MVPGGRAILEQRDGRVLLILRSDFRVWALPGGSPNEGECAEECILREIKEETGLVVEDYKACGFSSHPDLEVVRYPNGDQVHGFALILHATKWSGRFQHQSGEILDIQFVDPQRLPEMLPNERRSVEKFLDYKRTGLFQLY
jgi:8-oxo-dGTP pyrophosphatase MutT (NUDIX family)